MVRAAYPQVKFSLTREHMDDICVIRSMHANVPNHEPSLMLMNTGESRLVRLAWDHGFRMAWAVPTGTSLFRHDVSRWISDQGIAELAKCLSSRQVPGSLHRHECHAERLIDHIENKRVSKQDQRQQLDLLQKLNREHASLRGR